MSDDVRKTFAHPGALYRGKPFWAWNDKLDADECRRQIRIFHRMGLGGFFMHSRVGLDTPYLEDEWFDIVDACLDEAKKLDMEAWLYDEDRWPSGAAGGLVTCEARFRQRALHMVICDSIDTTFTHTPLAMFSAVVDGNSATDVRRLNPDQRGDALEPDGASLLAFFVIESEPDSWYNGQTYLDTMNPDAVDRFIEVTYDAYLERYPAEFGHAMPGIFTDEPNFGILMTEGELDGFKAISVPWTDRLPEVFQERYGYDVLDFLPHLFLNVDGEALSRPRAQYHDCTTYLFVDSFAKRIGDWCERNNILFTGHVLGEESLQSQTKFVGAAMPFYEYMQAPGIDQLSDYWHEYSTATQCASVQHQMGRRWMLSELYGCTGWDWPFEGHKNVGDWQACLGVNLRCQHLSWYSMKGQRKRDYPASISFQSPWWEFYSKVEDYFARMNVVLSDGKPVRRLLVVHPVESVHARTTVGWDKDAAVQRLESAFQTTIRILLSGHVGFDLGDEEMMSRLADVREGHDPVFRVGKAEYDVVLVPPMDTMRASTLSLLQNFQQAGGTVVFAGEPASMVDVQPSAEVVELARACHCVSLTPGSDDDALPAAPLEWAAYAPLDSLAEVGVADGALLAAVAGARRVSITGADGNERAGVFHQLRRAGEEHRLFIINRRRDEATGPLTVHIAAQGNLQLWDAETGERMLYASEPDADGLRFSTDLPPSGSRLFAVVPIDEALPPAPIWTSNRTVDLSGNDWHSELTEPNVLVLDTAEYKLDDGDWLGPHEILKVDSQLRDMIGLPRRGGRMVQPWARETSAADGPNGRVTLLFRFQIDDIPSGPVTLAIENPECFHITLNGHDVTPDDDCGWWVDPSLRMLPLDASTLMQGENIIILTGTMDDDTQLEACFLLGEFGVALDGSQTRICGDRPNVTFGDWTRQGLPFYGGAVVYRTTWLPDLAAGERAFVEVPEFAGTCARVLVNGRQAGIIGWQPHEVDVTELVTGHQSVTLTVEVVGHRRNAFGPLHLDRNKHVSWTGNGWTGPGEFITHDSAWSNDYDVVPVGCLTPPQISVRS